MKTSLGTVFSLCSLVLLTGVSPVLGGDYELIMKSAVIKSTKANGDKWDVGGISDPYVYASIVRGGKATLSGKTKVLKDTFTPKWDETVLAVDVGDDIVLQVWDKDIQFDDLIGEYKFTVTKEMIQAGEAKVKFGQVDELHYAIRRNAVLASIENIAKAKEAAKLREIAAAEEAARQQRAIELAKQRAIEEEARQRELARQREAAAAQEMARQRELGIAQQRTNARLRLTQLEQNVKELNERISGAQVAALFAETVYNNAEPGSLKAAAAETAWIIAQKKLQDLKAELGSVQFEVESSRKRILQLQE